MKYPDKQKSLKSALNENLSSTVKALHQESAQKTEIDASITSNNDTAGHLLAVLEAAFIHGLKGTYYDKHKRSKELPKPQFWDLIQKISHKDTLTQIHKLSYIHTRVGRCRAWLRVSLNESALSSYLSSLLHTTEYKSLVSRYYDIHALFRDSEQCDIFLRYLQGIENLSFELSCNAAILNLWTRTPLELAGVINTTSKKRYAHILQNGNSNSALSKSLGLTHSSSWNQLQLSSSRSHSQQSLANSFQMPLSSSPSLSLSSQMSGSLNSVHIFPTSEVENMVEVHPDTGQASSPVDVDCNIRSADSVLHSRHLAKKKSKRKKKHNNDDLLSSGSRSRCSSISSLTSSTSSGNILLLKDDHLAIDIGCRTGSTSSCDNIILTAPSVPERSSVYENVYSNKSSPRIHETPKNLSARSVPRNLSSQQTVETDGASNSNVNKPRLKLYDSALDVTLTQDKVDLMDDKPPRKIETLPNITSSTTTQSRSAQQPATEEIEEIDIYALRSSVSSTSHLDTIEETFTEVPSTPMSPGYGNSLLCGVGWSSDNSPDVGAEKNPSFESVTSPLTSKTTQKQTTTPNASSTVFGRKEGYLKKKGEFLFSRERWFVLTADTLSYYKDRTSSEELEILHLIDVEDVDDRDIERTKSIHLKMANGSEHCLSGEKSLIAEWTKDIRRAVEEAKIDSSAYNLDSVENTYEVFEAYDVNKESQFSTSSNTSWFSLMKSHMTKIANEKGLDAQNYQCADCASPIGMIYGAPRVCTFTGKYYCRHCHRNDEHIIPARIIHNWDFKKHKVSKRSKKFLFEMWKEPCIDLNLVNPSAYRHLPELQKILPLRQKLTSLYPYISTCRLIPVGDFDSKLRGHFYMLDNPHLYSAHDLHKTLNDALHDVISKAVTSGIDHVLSCQLCSSKGFICEVCRKNEIIFAFQTDTTSQCEECKSVYHKDCLPDLSKCLKCERRNRRLKEVKAIIVEEKDIDNEIKQ